MPRGLKTLSVDVRALQTPGIGAKYAALQEVIGCKIEGSIWRHANERWPEALEQRSSALMPRDGHEGIGYPCTL